MLLRINAVGLVNGDTLDRALDAAGHAAAGHDAAAVAGVAVLVGAVDLVDTALDHMLLYKSMVLMPLLQMLHI